MAIKMPNTNPLQFDEYMQSRVDGREYKTDGHMVPDGMHLEILRLRTYKNWPRWAPMMPNRLAKHGFFYTGRDDEVQCFSCGGHVRGWHADDMPELRHKDVNRSCLLLIGREKNNVSLPRPLPGSAEAGGSLVTQSLPSPPTQLPPELPPRSVLASAPPQNPPPPLTTLLPDYKNEQVRRETFRNWPTNAYVGPDELAQAGFIYLGSQDRVQCVFCKGTLRNWAPGDRAFHEHQKKFPSCPFVNNPRIGSPSERVVSRGAASKSAISTTDPALESLHALGIDTDMPRNHSMALLLSRTESFKNWPKTRIQKPLILAEAGFYYIERGDSVKCYWCDGGLKNWEAGDDPWVEHARWFPKCGHIKRNKGQDFVDHVTKHGKAPENHSMVSTSIDVREITSRMDTAMVRGVLGMGFDRAFVQNVIYYRLITHGDDFPTSEELLDTILNYTERPPADFPLPLPSAQTPPAGATASPTPAATPAAVAVADDAAATPPKKRKKKKKNKNASASATSASASTSSASAETSQTSTEGGNDGNDSGTEMPMDTEASAAAMVLDDDDDDDSTHGRMECRICMAKEVDILFLPCRHLVCCHDCAPPLNKCPLCRAPIQGTINVYMP